MVPALPRTAERSRSGSCSRMAQHQSQLPLARFGGDIAEAVGAEILELVDDEIEGDAIFGEGRSDGATRHCGVRKTGDEHGTDEVRMSFAECALAQVGKQDLALVHDFGKVDAA